MKTTLPEPTLDITPPQVNLVGALKSVLKPLASLQFTVALFVMSLIIVFFGTVAQIDNGIWTVVDNYFWSWIVMIPLELFAKVGHVFFYIPKDVHLKGSFPFPAGKVLALALCVNIIAAHLVRFRFTWKRSGVMILHSGLLLLLAGEVITREASLEQRMVIPEGGSADYAFDIRNAELAFGKLNADGSTEIVAIPQSRLVPGTTITHDALPVDVHVISFFKNAKLQRVTGKALATHGAGVKIEAVEAKETSGVSNEATVDIPAGYVDLRTKGTDKSLGTYMISMDQGLDGYVDDIAIAGKNYTFTLRPTRHYKPFRLELIKFKFDRYVGTEKAKNYSSQVRLIDPERKQDEEILISMNNPLRHRGEAFFQADYDKKTETTTILQVVSNPGWTLPYAACVVVSTGMFIHFGILLWGFLKKQRPQAVATLSPWQRRLPWLAAALVVLAFLGVTVRLMKVKQGEFNLDGFAKLPVVDGGRVKPMETVARVHLRLMSNREEVKDNEDNKRSAIQWLLECMSAPREDLDGPAANAKIFHVENEHVLGLLNLDKRPGYNYSYREIEPKADALKKSAVPALKKKDTERTQDEAKIIEAVRKIEYYKSFNANYAPMMLPIDAAKDVWKSVGELREEVAPDAAQAVMTANKLEPAMLKTLKADQRRELLMQLGEEQSKLLADVPGVAAWERMMKAYRAKDAEKFNAALEEFRTGEASTIALHSTAITLETMLNRTQPLFYVIGFYVLAILLGLIAMLVPGWFEPLRRAAFNVLIVTVIIHTAGLVARMVIQGRPPVTNLYSSAIYIGWGCALLGVLLEQLYRRNVGTLVGAALGFAGSLVAHNYLGTKDDTLEMLVAVLDTNFWLATHVTCITFGYVATYVAGAAGIAYLVAVIFVKGVTSAIAKDIARMVYSITCFATLLSFVGTVLGGIWADQSWGRFWGWDPKENGAILLVIWNVLILHARWAGLVKDRGVAVLAVLGGIVTTWSWFGTNQLSVGLHNYGFSSELAVLCLGVWSVLGFIAAVGAFTPRTAWRSELRVN